MTRRIVAASASGELVGIGRSVAPGERVADAARVAVLSVFAVALAVAVAVGVLEGGTGVLVRVAVGRVAVGGISGVLVGVEVAVGGALVGVKVGAGATEPSGTRIAASIHTMLPVIGVPFDSRREQFVPICAWIKTVTVPD